MWEFAERRAWGERERERKVEKELSRISSRSEDEIEVTGSWMDITVPSSQRVSQVQTRRP